MARQSQRLTLIFAGAPTYQEVCSFTKNVHDLPSLKGPLSDVAEGNEHQHFNRYRIARPFSGAPAWRVVQTKKSKLVSGYSQIQWLKEPISSLGEHDHDRSLVAVNESIYPSQGFASSDDLDEQNDNDQTDEEDLLERSFAVHEGLDLDDSADSFVALGDLDASPSAHIEGGPLGYAALRAPHLTSLSQLPSATHITRINPQTISVDLIVGIITSLPPRRVTVRKTQKPMDLIEMIVGDETAAGFSISFWMAVDKARRHHSDGGTDDYARRLRAGDVAMLRNIALSQFRGKVHGQSLRRYASANSVSWGTSIDIIPHGTSRGTSTRSSGNTDTIRGHGSAAGVDHVAQKIDKVIAWTGDFVAPSTPNEKPKQDQAHGLGRKRKRLVAGELPADDTP
ncbi:MAG: hypothetical protein M1828_001311 [Chrysothrix sp. TS-e1954]|nr:MAG: hypothetical protein M1828_001311 [Chrysothrix sp. TS-e1954]